MKITNRVSIAAELMHVDFSRTNICGYFKIVGMTGFTYMNILKSTGQILKTSLTSYFIHHGKATDHFMSE